MVLRAVIIRVNQIEQRRREKEERERAYVERMSARKRDPIEVIRKRDAKQPVTSRRPGRAA